MNAFYHEPLGLISALLVIFALFPLCQNILKNKTIPLSKLSLSLLLSGSALWIFYGIDDSAPGLVLLAAFGFVISAILLIIKMRTETLTNN